MSHPAASVTLPVNDQAKALQRHLMQCAKARGRWFGVSVWAERLHGMILPRLATTAALGGLTLAAVAHWL